MQVSEQGAPLTHFEEEAGTMKIEKTAVRRKPATLVRKSTVEIVANEIRRQILSGELKEGEPLQQSQLAEQLGVSHIPLREAFRQLEAEGLVNIQSHKGGVVSFLSLDQIQELFDIRACLETWLIATAIPLMRPDDLKKAEACLEAMHEGEVEHWGELNWAFHHALYAPARKEATVKILRQLHQNIDRYLRIQISMTSGWREANADHQELIELCKAKDVKRAMALLDNHIMNAARDLLSCLSEIRGLKSA